MQQRRGSEARDGWKHSTETSSATINFVRHTSLERPRDGGRLVLAQARQREARVRRRDFEDAENKRVKGGKVGEDGGGATERTWLRQVAAHRSMTKKRWMQAVCCLQVHCCAPIVTLTFGVDGQGEGRRRMALFPRPACPSRRMHTPPMFSLAVLTSTPAVPL